MNSVQLFNLATVAYFVAMVLLVVFLVVRRLLPGRIAIGAVWLGFAAHTAAIALRWVESYRLPGEVGHAPLSNLYESMVFFAWTIVLFYVGIDLKYRKRAVGVFVVPFALLAMCWAQLRGNDAIEPLMPALQSNWLTYHVVTCFLGYAAFAVGCAVSLMYVYSDFKSIDAYKNWWVKWFKSKTKLQLAFLFFIFPGFPYILLYGISGFIFAVLKIPKSFPALEVLDDLNYKAIMIGFPFLTLGIVTGAAWANYAWGTYWSWDPKETWSLIVWFIYAAFLHARLTRGWTGRRTAWLSVFGFAATIFCYLGVNLFLPGLHSYGSG